MKIISWNVNGYHASVKKGLYDFLFKVNPDIVCLQETKTQIKGVDTGVLSEYYQYWNSCNKKGYSGVAVFTKYRPIDVFYDMGDDEIDWEGRMIVLEYNDFYVVNVYVPNSQKDLRRYNFRILWDEKFSSYVETLVSQKAVILCGDMNVAFSVMDVYEGKYNESGFLDAERDGFERLLNKGLIDAYRWIYPTTVSYTWWPPRGQKREKDQGWRLDYFLVSTNLAVYIEDSYMWPEVKISDHCPIELDIQLDAEATAKKLSMRARNANYLWETFDWARAERRLFELQKEMVNAELEWDNKKVAEIQNKIVHSFECRMLAVQHVSRSKTPGIDGVLWESGSDKVEAVASLTNINYRASSTRHVQMIDKKGRERYVNIPTLYDRAMLCLYGYTLSPIAETLADRKSFAFRKGRSALDVHAYICRELGGRDKPEWLLIVDVEQFYHNISHYWLLNHIPMDRKVLNEFLKAGYIFQGELFEADDYGIDLGSSLSPILGNMILDGLQKTLYRRLYPKQMVDHSNGNLIRFADDMIITAATREIAEQLKEVVVEFLRERGLRINEKKTKIVHVRQGFDFLSKHYIKTANVLYVTPSTQAVILFEHRLEQVINEFKGAQIRFIQRLNRILLGWANWYRMCDCNEVFAHIDRLVDALLLRKMQRLHPQYKIQTLIDRYWYVKIDGTRYFTLKNQQNVRVVKLSELPLYRYYAVKADYNPYLDEEYLKTRTEEREVRNVVGKWRKLWDTQNGKCYYCGKKILADELREVVRIRYNETEINRYVHTKCATEQFFSYETDNLEKLDFKNIIDMINNPGNHSNRFNKYYELQNYFHQMRKPIFSMTFREIEEIIGFELCKSARKYNHYWFKSTKYSLSQAWLSQGYYICNLDLIKEKVSFRRTDKGLSSLNIPEKLLYDKIPNNAVTELEEFFKYIIEKYGL